MVPDAQQKHQELVFFSLLTPLCEEKKEKDDYSTRHSFESTLTFKNDDETNKILSATGRKKKKL